MRSKKWVRACSARVQAEKGRNDEGSFVEMGDFMSQGFYCDEFGQNIISLLFARIPAIKLVCTNGPAKGRN